MSDGERNSGQPLPADSRLDPPDGAVPAPAGAARAGQMLRQMRESAGVDPALLASALKITPQKIHALEEGRLDDLPGLSFARGLAATICRYFAADPESVLAHMPQATTLLNTKTRALEQVERPAFYANSSNVVAHSQPTAVPGWLLALVAVLLVAALAVWLAPGQWLASGSSQQAASAADGAAGGPEPVASEAEATSSESAAEPASEPEPPASVAAPAAQALATEASAPQPGEAVVEQNVLTFKATNRSWVGVKDGSGKMILDRILSKGDTLSMGGQLPLTVSVGDKTAMIVSVRGQRLDLEQHLYRGTVARFTVEPVASP